jgi:hypothetical protein
MNVWHDKYWVNANLIAEVDSWMRELRTNSYVEIKDTSLDSKSNSAKISPLH